MTVSLSNGKPQDKPAPAFEAISGYTGWLTGKRLGIGIAFVALYLVAERLTLIHDIAPLNITPWNPAAGMAVALLLAGSLRKSPAPKTVRLPSK
jgi:two-component system, LuxR family, sensor kinase FixL